MKKQNVNTLLLFNNLLFNPLGTIEETHTITT
jgi:hypothetical protein